MRLACTFQYAILPFIIPSRADVPTQEFDLYSGDRIVAQS